MNKMNFKLAVKRLSKFFDEKNITIPHSRVMDSVAVAMGYKNYPDYAIKTNDPSKVENMRSRTLVIRHSEHVKGQDILRLIMEAFEGYFIKATPMISKNHPSHFPIPEYKEFHKDKMIVTWEPHNGHFAENTSVQVLLVFLFPILKRKYPNIFNHVTDMKYIERKVQVEDMNAILTM